MKKIYLTILLFFLIIPLSACSLASRPAPAKQPRDASGRLKVAATIFPLYDLVRQVGGDKIDLIQLLPSGSSPHTFEISPADAKKLAEVQIMFTIGAGLDSWAANLGSLGVSGVEIADLSKKVDLRPFSASSSPSEIGQSDPHYWLDPNQAQKMVGAIADALSAQDPVNAAYYASAAAAYNEKLKLQDEKWQQQLSVLSSRQLFVFHDGWQYLAAHFQLQIAAAFEPFPGQTPTPQELAALQSAVKEYRIKAIFMEPQLADSAASSLSQDLNLSVYSLDPLGGMKDRASYLDLMDYNVKTLSQALK